MDKQKIPYLIKKQKKFFNSGKTRDLDFRKDTLKTLKNRLKDFSDEIVEAIHKDMRRSFFESYGAEVAIVLDEINYVLKNLKNWMKPVKIRPGLAHFKSSSRIESKPKGVVFIVSAWNYPVHLCIMPLISAIAAGNTVILKPSELAVNSAKIVEKILNVFPDEYIAVFQGGKEVAQEFLKHRFGHILFTGSEKVGKIYAKAAAETLTPITLEMGGKSPTIVDKTAKLDIATDRIAFAKYLNAGQTCVAPDYILAHSSIKEALVEKLQDTLQEFYGDDPLASPDFARIINEDHLNRLKLLLESVDVDSIVIGGEIIDEEKYVAPTIIDEPPVDSKIMKEEIFGPILPIIEYDEFEDIQKIISKNPFPLALYIFSEDKEFIETVSDEVQSGDMAINDAAIHFSIGGLKVGGMHNSGLGGYRGKVGFDTFSHKRSVFQKSTWFNLPFTKPPYTNLKEKLLKFFFR